MGGIFPGGNLSGWEFPGWQFSGWEFTRWEFSGWEFIRWELCYRVIALVGTRFKTSKNCIGIIFSFVTNLNNSNN